MTEETPAKVVSLLGVALTSLALLLTITTTNASFDGTRQPLADPFSPDKVVAVIDNTAAGYSQFLDAFLFSPLKENYALAADNFAWIGSNAHDGLVAMLGLPDSSSAGASSVAQAPSVGRVAGAHTSRYVEDPNRPGLLDSIYSLLIQ